MPIERVAMVDVMPSWAVAGGHRFLSHPELRLCFLQLSHETEIIYVVSDQPLPETLNDAIAIVEAWRISHEID